MTTTLTHRIGPDRSLLVVQRYENGRIGFSVYSRGADCAAMAARIDPDGTVYGFNYEQLTFEATTSDEILYRLAMTTISNAAWTIYENRWLALVGR